MEHRLTLWLHCSIEFVYIILQTPEVTIFVLMLLRRLSNVRFRNVGGKTPQQTEPPSVPVADFFPSGVFPEGEWQSYKNE